MIGSRHIDIIKYTFEKIKKKYFPKPKECEVVLILTIEGAKLVVEEITECIKSNYSNSEYVNVKEGTKAENVQES